MGPIAWRDMPEPKVRRPFHDPQSGGLTVGEKISYMLEAAMREVARKQAKK